MSNRKPIEAWHFLPDNGRLRYEDNRKPSIGRIYRATGELSLCKNGMHASTDIMDALSYAPGSILCRVEIIPPYLTGDDKVCGRGRKILWKIDAEMLLHEFACRCAVRALRIAKVTDARCWDAIKVKRRWIAGKADNSELAAARDAARAAAWDAARDAARDAAWDAAWGAARAAAWDAARDAARDAALGAALGAAWGAEKSWQRKTLLRMIAAKRKEDA